MERKSIIIKNAVKDFKETRALDDVSLEFEQGKIHGIIGRNGSGKTVLMKAICGFVPLTSGEIYVNGLQIGKDIDIPRDVGIIIEAPGFLPNYSGFKNLEFLASIKRTINKSMIKDVIRRVGLDPESPKWVSKYSLGMRQRLGIAQAIMENPSILILDEPMNGLDNRGVQEIRTLLMNLRDEGKTILIASHSTEDISILCDTVHELDGGHLVK